MTDRPAIRYTRRWERWLAVVWPPKRREHERLNMLAKMSYAEIARAHNEAMTRLLLGNFEDPA